MSAATQDLYALASAYAHAKAIREDNPTEFYVWIETAHDVRMLKTNRISGQHFRFQSESEEYPVPISPSEIDSSSRGYLAIQHSASTVLVGYSPCTGIWSVSERLRKHIRKLWPKYAIIEEV